MTRLAFTTRKRHILLTYFFTRVDVLSWSGRGNVSKDKASMQEQSSFGALLKHYRLAAGLSQVALAAVRDAALVPGAISQALGIYESANASLAEQVRVFLRPKHLLLVLDNVEQVLDSASFAADLLANCPHLFILVTSRTPLRLRAEQEVQLAPLPLKDAVTLFCERARAVRPAQVYAVSEVAAICQQVD